MLRHIVSVSLAMTACAALMPTKANAATLTVTPVGEITKNPGDSIEFSFVLTPAPSSTVKVNLFASGRDSSELSSSTGGTPFEIGSLITMATTFTSRHTVLTPVKDGISDLNVLLLYDEFGPSGTFTNLQATALGADVVPVPEPLTIFGTATAFGCGVLFKRKSSKKTIS